jgi:hypothetical protein
MSKTYEVSDMSGGLNVRLALPGDEEPILSCLRAAFEPFREQYTLGAYRDTVLTAESLAERISHMAVFVAADDKDQSLAQLPPALNRYMKATSAACRYCLNGKARAWRTSY